MERGVRDVPHPGEIIKKDRPICTVFARSSSRQECLAALRAQEEDIVKTCVPRSPELRMENGF
jgi:predicted ATP-grasp superfamily ATP-dependent carboligase